MTSKGMFRACGSRTAWLCERFCLQFLMLHISIEFRERMWRCKSCHATHVARLPSSPCFLLMVNLTLCLFSSFNIPEKLQTLWRQKILYDVVAVFMRRCGGNSSFGHCCDDDSICGRLKIKARLRSLNLCSRKVLDFVSAATRAR